MGFFRQEYWGGLPFPDIPDPGIKPMSPVSPALYVDFLPLSYQGRHNELYILYLKLTIYSPEPIIISQTNYMSI